MLKNRLIETAYYSDTMARNCHQTMTQSCAGLEKNYRNWKLPPSFTESDTGQIRKGLHDTMRWQETNEGCLPILTPFRHRCVSRTAFDVLISTINAEFKKQIVISDDVRVIFLRFKLRREDFDYRIGRRRAGKYDTRLYSVDRNAVKAKLGFKTSLDRISVEECKQTREPTKRVALR